MTDFITHLNKLKKQKLSEIEAELQAENQAALEQLAKQADQAKTAYQRQKSQLHNQLISQHTFSAEQKTSFDAQKLQLDLLDKAWHEVTTEFFKQEKNLANWLSHGLDLIKDQEGVLKTGKSLDMVKKIVTGNTKITINQDERLNQELGFVFETESEVFDFRLESFLSDLFQEHKHRLFKSLFAKE